MRNSLTFRVTRAVQDAVRLCDAEGVEFARGLCNYAFTEVERMKVCHRLYFSTHGPGTVSMQCAEDSKVCCLLHAHRPVDQAGAAGVCMLAEHALPYLSCLLSCSRSSLLYMVTDLDGILSSLHGPCQGKSSRDFAEELGYVGSEEVVHRDNICQLTQRRASGDGAAPGAHLPQAAPDPESRGPQGSRSGPASGTDTPERRGAAAPHAAPDLEARAPEGLRRAPAPVADAVDGRSAAVPMPRSGRSSGRASGTDSPQGRVPRVLGAAQPGPRHRGDGPCSAGVSPEDIAGRLALLRWGGHLLYQSEAACNEVEMVTLVLVFVVVDIAMCGHKLQGFL